MMNAGKKCYQRDPSIVSREIAGATVLVPIRQSVGDLESIYTLNETASFAWQRFDGERTLEEIKHEVLAAFEADETEVERDLLDLVEQLVAIGALGAV